MTLDNGGRGQGQGLALAEEMCCSTYGLGWDTGVKYTDAGTDLC